MSLSIDADTDVLDLASMLDLDGVLPGPVETALIDTVKALATTVPTPRYDPFHGIDRAGAPSLAAVECLSRHGDFRKYVHVLDVRAGVGGAARWLALRYGCRVVALDPRPGLARLGNVLSRRAGLRGRVVGLAGIATRIPARDAAFTQVWCLGGLDDRADRRAVLAELFRVLRPGSPIALQARVVDAVAEAASAGDDVERPLPTLGAYRTALANIGFGTIDCDDVTELCAETSPVVLSARATFARMLRERAVAPATARTPAADAAVLGAGPAAQEGRIVQLFARRPST